MEIATLQWECFRLANQEKRPLKEVGEILGITPAEVKEQLKVLRKVEPELFPYEREYLEFGHQGMNRYSKLLPLNDICEEDIEQKW